MADKKYIFTDSAAAFNDIYEALDKIYEALDKSYEGWQDFKKTIEANMDETNKKAIKEADVVRLIKKTLDEENKKLDVFDDIQEGFNNGRLNKTIEDIQMLNKTIEALGTKDKESGNEIVKALQSQQAEISKLTATMQHLLTQKKQGNGHWEFTVNKDSEGKMTIDAKELAS